MSSDSFRIAAKELYWRFEEKVRERLLQIAWRDWPREKLRAAMGDFRKLGAEAFVEKYGGDQQIVY